MKVETQEETAEGSMLDQEKPKERLSEGGLRDLSAKDDTLASPVRVAVDEANGHHSPLAGLGHWSATTQPSAVDVGQKLHEKSSRP